MFSWLVDHQHPQVHQLTRTTKVGGKHKFCCKLCTLNSSGWSICHSICPFETTLAVTKLRPELDVQSDFSPSEGQTSKQRFTDFHLAGLLSMLPWNGFLNHLSQMLLPALVASSDVAEVRWKAKFSIFSLNQIMVAQKTQPKLKILKWVCPETTNSH